MKIILLEFNFSEKVCISFISKEFIFGHFVFKGWYVNQCYAFCFGDPNQWIILIAESCNAFDTFLCQQLLNKNENQ